MKFKYLTILCILSNPLLSQDQSPLSYYIRQDVIQALSQKNIKSLTHRSWQRNILRGALGITLIASFLMNHTDTKHIEEKLALVTQDLNAVKTTLIQSTASSSALPTTLVNRIWGDIKNIVLSSVNTTWTLTKYVVISAVTQKFVSAVFDPLIDPFLSTATLTAADSWFIAEQTPHSSAMFVVVQEELQPFITLLMRIDATLDQLPLIQKKEDSFLIHESLTSLVYLGEELIAYMQALAHHEPSFKQLPFNNLMKEIHYYLAERIETFARNIHTTLTATPSADITDACRDLKEKIHAAIRPLQQFDPYRILPWPFAIACQEALYRIIATYCTAHIQPIQPSH